MILEEFFFSSASGEMELVNQMRMPLMSQILSTAVSYPQEELRDGAWLSTPHFSDFGKSNSVV